MDHRKVVALENRLKEMQFVSKTPDRSVLVSDQLRLDGELIKEIMDAFGVHRGILHNMIEIGLVLIMLIDFRSKSGPKVDE